jgi:hypothetical protein
VRSASANLEATMNGCAKRLFAGCLATGFFTSAGHAEPNKVEYELAEKCGRSVATWFKSEYKEEGVPINTRDGQMIAAFRSHYNRKLNKCFLLLTINTFKSKKSEGDLNSSTQHMLVDFLDNNEIGTFFQFFGITPTSCNVNETHCRSEAEWQFLAKPFMED